MTQINSKIGIHKIRLSSVDSTNNFAAKLINQGLGFHGSVILAENQTNGRGQMQSEWQSETAQNILSSFIFEFSTVDSQNLFDVNNLVSIVLLEFLQLHSLESHIKWPNDILVGKKKIAGILVENKFLGSKLTHSIVGIGLNVNQMSFPNLDTATSMQLETSESYSIESLWISLIDTFRKWEGFLGTETKRRYLKNIYKNNLFGKDQHRSFMIDNKIVDGTIRGVDAYGRLALELEGKVHYFQNKQLKFL
jgi:BirA family biotin operon repressor/biotin-[acetyl-CoA-carboxylase] ligase